MRGCGLSRVSFVKEVRVYMLVCACMGLTCTSINASVCSRVGVHVSMSTLYVCACAMDV